MSDFNPIIPLVPNVNLFKDPADASKGILHPQWQSYFSLLQEFLHRNLGKEGLINPSQPTSNISLLTNAKNGTVLYDSTLHKLKVNENGVFKTVTTT